MISMPIVSKQLHVCEPLVSDDATMGKAILGLSKLATGEIKMLSIVKATILEKSTKMEIYYQQA